MAPLPDYRPKQLSLGPLEAEILNIIWELGSATVKDVHDRILADPNRELAYTSVTTVLRRLTDKGWLACTVLRRLTDKGWLACDKKERAFYWRPMLSKQQSDVIKAHEQLQRFLAVGNPDVVAAFADSLDEAASEQIAAIAKRIQSARQAREEK